MKTIHPKSRTTRSGFTLIELLAVITIIAILLALILPAIGNVMRRARNAEVSAEITRLETAIASFKAENGIEPWSEIVLTEDPGSFGWPADSRTKLRKLFPQFSFTGQIDFNNDGFFTGDPAYGDGRIDLTGSECLVFFLGGMQNNGTVIGFSKNPLSPFIRSGNSRTVSLHEFDVSRLRDADGDEMLDYFDPLDDQDKPYAYASSNNGQGYSSASGVYYLDGSGKPWKPTSHQIISPGEDGEFGPPTATPPVYTPDLDLTGDRRIEADNITNFSGGTLN